MEDLNLHFKSYTRSLLYLLLYPLFEDMSHSQREVEYGSYNFIYFDKDGKSNQCIERNMQVRINVSHQRL